MKYYIAVNFKVFLETHPSGGYDGSEAMVTFYVVKDKDYELGYPNSPSKLDDKETRRVYSTYKDYFRNLYLDSSVIDYLEDKGYEFRTGIIEDTEQNILYFNNEQDIKKLIDDIDAFKVHDRHFVKESLKYIKSFNSFKI